MDKRSKVARRDHLARVVKAIGNDMKGDPPLQLAGETYTPQQLAQAFQDELDALRGIDLARGAYAAAVVKERKVKARNKPLHRALEGHVRSKYGENAASLSHYDLEPSKQGKKTTKEKADAAKKGADTRKERGTMGPKQRKKSEKG